MIKTRSKFDILDANPIKLHTIAHHAVSPARVCQKKTCISQVKFATLSLHELISMLAGGVLPQSHPYQLPSFKS